MGKTKRKPKGSPKTIRLTTVANNLLVLLSEKYGISQTGILEIIIREKAQREGVSHD